MFCFCFSLKEMKKGGLNKCNITQCSVTYTDSAVRTLSHVCLMNIPSQFSLAYASTFLRQLYDAVEAHKIKGQVKGVQK